MDVLPVDAPFSASQHWLFAQTIFRKFLTEASPPLPVSQTSSGAHELRRRWTLSPWKYCYRGCARLCARPNVPSTLYSDGYGARWGHDYVNVVTRFRLPLRCGRSQQPLVETAVGSGLIDEMYFKYPVPFPAEG